MSINIKSGDSINEVNVDLDNNLKVNLPKNLFQTGYMSLAGEVDDGSVLGYPTIRPYYITQDFRTNRNLEKTIWQDTFSTTVLNNSKYKATTTNQAIILSGGGLNLNANYSVTNGDFSLVQTFKTFSLYENAPTYVNFKLKFDNTLQTNSVIEYGLGIVSGVTTPTDGIFFRTSGNTLNGVVSYSGVETTILNVFSPVIGETNDYLIAITDMSAEFWVNNILVGVITPTINLIIFTSTTVTATTAGYCTSVSNSLPLFIRNKNTGTVPSAIKVILNNFDVLFGDIKTNKDYKTTMVTNGQSSISTPDGQASLISGTTSANILNSTAPITLTNLENTSGGYITLGGDFSIPSTGTSENDYIVFAYLNPAGTATIPGKTLVINNVYINTFTSGATIGATGTTLQWIIGIGSTAIPLTEVDSVTGGTRATRRIGLGVQSIPALSVIGTMATPMIIFESASQGVNLTNPLMVEDGTYCHIILKMPITVTATSLTYRGNIIINGYWE